MRILRLDLKAFGPFTGRSLVFDSHQPGLHIIFGPNEAGKSSSLRGLKALLYGFHPQTPDNFLHNYDQLLVGGSLENSNGQQLTFLRRKKRVNDLIDPDGNPLDKDRLTSFLHGVDSDIFESVYGIDHQRLVAGGNEILAQQGEVGKALFAAGAGISSLKEVLDQLDQEASTLFKPGGSKPEINQAIKLYKEQKQAVKSASLAPSEWKEIRGRLHAGEEKRARLEKERGEKNKLMHRLGRLEQAIPELAALKKWQEAIAGLGKVAILPKDIDERHRQVEQALRDAKLKLQTSSDRLKQVEKRRSTLSLNMALVEQAEVVDDFHQRFGAYRKGQQDIPERKGMRISLRKEAALLLKQIRPDLSLDQIESLRPMLTKKRTVQTLSSIFEATSLQVRQTGKQIRQLEHELQEVEKKLAAMPAQRDPQALTAAVKLARKAGDIDSQIARGNSENKLSRKECMAELKRIGLWSGELPQLMELTLPFAETVQRFEEQFRTIDHEQNSLEKERIEVSRKLNNHESELKKLYYGGEVPSEQNLRDTREKREQGWQLLRRQWLDRENVSEESRAFAPDKPLHDIYEELVGRADILADRLRSEADRVANAANLRAQVENQQEILHECTARKKELALRENNLHEEWAGVWEPLRISPRSPREMLAWMTAMAKLRFHVGDLLKKEEEIRNKEARQQNLRNTLLQELEKLSVAGIPVDEQLDPALVFAETLLGEIERQKAEKAHLQEQQIKSREALNMAEEESREAGEALAKWEKQWKQALAGLNLEENIIPHEAMDFIETLQTCLGKVREADDLQKRITGIQRDAEVLENEVSAFAQRVAPEMAELPLDQTIHQLRTLLGQAQKNYALHEQLTDEYNSLQAEVTLVENTLKDANEQLSELLSLAGCQKPEQLGGVITTFIEYQKLQEKISQSEATLARIGAGTSIEELSAQADGVSVDELPGQIESLRVDIEEKLNPAINDISQEIGELQGQLAAMDGTSVAAETSEKMEQNLARIRRLADHFIRVKLSARVLLQEIERYREKHQDPVLQIASRYFADLTLHSFAGLKTDVDDKGEPILVGIRPDGKWNGVSGMSDGTRDQLYLSLRLATIEWRLQSGEPMPLIVDDILINFDDERSLATLKSLANLGVNNQVILFTHHRRLVEQAETLKATQPVYVHEL